MSETPQPSKFVQMLNNAKPANMDDEKKETVLRRIKFTAACVAGVLTAVAIASTAKYYNSIPDVDFIEDETTED